MASNALRPATLSVPSIDMQQFAMMVTSSAPPSGSDFAYNLHLPSPSQQPDIVQSTMPDISHTHQAHTDPLRSVTTPQGFEMGDSSTLGGSDTALAYDLGLQPEFPRAEFTMPAFTNTASAVCSSQDNVRLTGVLKIAQAYSQ